MDDLQAYFELLGEDLVLDGDPVRGIFSLSGQELVNGLIANQPTVELPATAGAQLGSVVSRAGSAGTYSVRQLLPAPPDGLRVQLVLAEF